MNDNRMKRWMDAIDDDLLEEAQRSLPRGGAARRWGALAACFCAAALALALWQPWSAGNGEAADCGSAGGFNAMDKSFPVAMAPALDAEPLSASLALPEGASLTSDYQWRQDGEGAVTGVSCTVLLDGYDYDYGAAYASQPLPAPDGTLPADTWQVNGLTLLVYDDGAVGWYDTSAGIQWYCVAWDGGAPLVTAFTLMDAQYYTVPTAPEGADVLGYDLFDLDGATVTEVAFTLDGVTWHYRMAPTLYVSETTPDISGFTGGIGRLLGATGGYIIGFLASALLMWALEKVLGEKKWGLALSMLLGLIACYAFGTAWFLVVYTNAKGAISLAAVLGMCVIPYIIPDVIKIIVALSLTGALKRFVK